MLLQNGVTPVFIAAQMGHTAVLDVLIRAGADVKAACTVRREGRCGQGNEGQVVGVGSARCIHGVVDGGDGGGAEGWGGEERVWRVVGCDV